MIDRDAVVEAAMRGIELQAMLPSLAGRDTAADNDFA